MKNDSNVNSKDGHVGPHRHRSASKEQALSSEKAKPRLVPSGRQNVLMEYRPTIIHQKVYVYFFSTI